MSAFGVSCPALNIANLSCSRSLRGSEGGAVPVLRLERLKYPEKLRPCSTLSLQVSSICCPLADSPALAELEKSSPALSSTCASRPPHASTSSPRTLLNDP